MKGEQKLAPAVVMCSRIPTAENRRPGRCKAVRNVLAIAAAACLMVTVSGADNVARADYTWISFGGGPGSSYGGMAALGISFLRGNRIVCLRLTGGGEGDELFGPQPKESTSEAAILVGTGSQRSSRTISASVGLGITWGVRRGEPIKDGLFGTARYEEERFTKVGLAVQTQAFCKTLGFQLIGNINSQESFAGFILSLRLGRRH